MKTLKTRNGILFLLLMAGLIFNILWSLRLESTAQELSAKVIEHHGMLSQNKDILSMLDGFMRSVAGAAGVSTITVDGKGVEIVAGKNSIKLDGDMIFLGSQEYQLSMDNSEIGLHWPVADMHFSLDKKNASASMYSVDGDLQIGLFPKKDRIEIQRGKQKIGVGKAFSGDWYGVTLANDTPGKKGVIAVADEGIGIQVDKKLPIRIDVGQGEDFYVKLDPDNQRIEVKKDRSIIRIGKGSIGEGVELGEFDTGTIAVTKGKGVGIRGKESLEINFDGEINFTSKGNINIRSEQGDVKINGKKVLFNE